MGKFKIKIKKLETAISRQITYSKRKVGVVKKAQEVAILCDVELALLFFSPTDKPSLTVSPKSDFESVLQKLSEVDILEKQKRKRDTIEVLRKTYKNTDHQIPVEKLLSDGKPSMEELVENLEKLKMGTHEKNEKISMWTRPGDVEDFSMLDNMENALTNSVNFLTRQKVLLQDLHAHKILSGSWGQGQDLTVPFAPDQGEQGNPIFEELNSDIGIIQNNGGVTEPVELGFQPVELGFQYDYQFPENPQFDHLNPNFYVGESSNTYNS